MPLARRRLLRRVRARRSHPMPVPLAVGPGGWLRTDNAVTLTFDRLPAAEVVGARGQLSRRDRRRLAAGDSRSAGSCRWPGRGVRRRRSPLPEPTHERRRQGRGIPQPRTRGHPGHRPGRAPAGASSSADCSRHVAGPGSRPPTSDAGFPLPVPARADARCANVRLGMRSTPGGSRRSGTSTETPSLRFVRRCRAAGAQGDSSARNAGGTGEWKGPGLSTCTRGSGG